MKDVIVISRPHLPIHYERLNFVNGPHYDIANGQSLFVSGPYHHIDHDIPLLLSLPSTYCGMIKYISLLGPVHTDRSTLATIN